MTQKNFRSEAWRVFGPNAFATALFYQHEGALRFELSGRGSRFDLFLQALQRSEEIVEDAFSGADDLHVCITGFCPTSIFGARPILAALEKCEITIPRVRDVWGELYDADLADEDGIWYQLSLCFPIARSDVRKFLWGALSVDLGIKPALRAAIYLYSPGKQVLVHPYDDRGMDVIGPNAELLKSLYRRYGDWLSRHDRQAIDAVFRHA